MFNFRASRARSNGELKVYKPRSNFGKKMVRYAVIDFYNKIPPAIRGENYMSKFKRELKKI